MDLSPKFARRLRASECSSDEMRVPHGFCVQYGSRIPATVRVVIRTGYVIWVDFDKVNEKFKGLRDFYLDFGIKSGQTLLFEHGGGFDMKVCIIELYGTEIQYPNIVHKLQSCDTTPVSIYDGGIIFVRNLGWGGKVTDTVGVPFEFAERVGDFIPPKVEYQVSSGYQFVGKYLSRQCDLSGLQNVCNMLNVSDLNCFHMLVFTYHGGDKFSLIAIDRSHIEAPIAPITPDSGPVPDSFFGPTAFQIVIQDFHVLPYDYGVDIPAEFKRLCKKWRKIDYISAYLGSTCWKLEIRQRNDRRRTTINDGWSIFRLDLELVRGDSCLFEWRDGSIRNFDVRVLKYDDRNA